MSQSKNSSSRDPTLPDEVLLQTLKKVKKDELKQLLQLFTFLIREPLSPAPLSEKVLPQHLEIYEERWVETIQESKILLFLKFGIFTIIVSGYFTFLI